MIGATSEDGAAAEQQPEPSSSDAASSQKQQQQQQQQQQSAGGDEEPAPYRPPAQPSRPELPPSMHQMDNFARCKELVKKAIAAKHTFMIHGRARVVRECLLARGWCEKFHRKSAHAFGEPQLGVDSNPSALLAGVGNLNERANERVLISRMLGNHTVDFLWNAGSEWTGWPSQDNRTTIFNRFTRANFTSKVGLCSNVRQMHWYYEAGIANTLFPRCYNISQPDQLHAFIEDFRMTACLSLLKWLVDSVKDNGESSVRASNGVVPLRALDFAIGRCSDFIGSKSHEDIDQDFEKVWSHQWEQFISWYYKLVHGQGHLIANNVPIHKYLLASRHLLKKVKKFWPQLDMDGTLNIWILKPGNKSRGRGIVLMNKLEDILSKVNPTNKTTDTRFVVQKYIERPLVIYDTKFDIRQWFIVTNAQPLTLWIYKESYLRFCSQKFSLVDFHESIHLSNNAVQCKYKNCPDRDAALPNENMWDVATFKEYLKSRGNADAWEELIYPGMKQGLVGSLLASQEAMDRRKNSFELYGADFMVMEDFTVWLIEINSHPDMSSSTSVTTKLCRKVMEDTVKVVVDYRENPNADTGDFELAYKQKLSSCQAYLGTGLSLHGTRIDLTDKRSNQSGSALMLPAGRRKTNSPAFPGEASSRVGPVLVDLIEELELQLDREFFEYLKLRSASGLSRQSLPLELRPDMPESAAGDTQVYDVETNTNNIFPTSSQSALKSPAAGATSQRNTIGKTSKNSGKFTAAKKFGKHRTSNSQGKTAEAATPKVAKTLISKMIDIQKESNKNLPNKPVSPSGRDKLIRATKVPESSTPFDETSTKAREDSPQKNQKNDRKSQLGVAYARLIPPIPSALITNRGGKSRTSQSAAEGLRPHPLKKQTRAKPNQVLVDVMDMYAVGLAVNK